MKRIKSESYKKIRKIAGAYCPSCSPTHNDSTPPCEECPECSECHSAMKWGGHGNHWWFCENCNETYDVELSTDDCEHCGIGTYGEEEGFSDFGSQTSRGDMKHRTEPYSYKSCSHCGYDPAA